MVRGMPLLFLLTLAAASLALPGSAGAQTGGLVITSQPPGAVVELSGEHVLRGVTPWRLDRPLWGAYEVRAFKAGHEMWEGYVVLSATRTDSLSIRMVRKTPLRAGFRSAILPGWGQHYTGQGGKGAAFAVAQAAALAGVLWTDAKRQTAEERYNAAAAAYDAATQIDDIQEKYAELLRRYDDLNTWHEQRKRWSYAAAAIWLVNVLDATLLFPSYGEGRFAVTDGPGPGFFASMDADRTTFGVAFGF
ncbi:MAG: PEGA domain-containing protein [Candidatus Eisenbacteria bacterium]|nr:PEGA domain-containing protein [Candidatus Eisenbacteria bacterium]